MFVKKLLLKVGLMLGGLFGVLMFLPGPNGEPMMSWEDLPGFGIFNAATELVESAGDEIEERSGGNEIYQWKDEHGTVHYGDKPVNGASLHKISSINDPIPSENFTGEAFRKKKTVSKPRVFKIEDSRFSSKSKNGDKNDGKSSINPEDFDDLKNGDYSNAREIIDELPDYLQEQHAKRMQAVN